MLRALLLALIVLVTALSGCLWWGDDEDGDGTPGPSPSPTPGPDDNRTEDGILVSIDNVTDAVTEGTPLNVSWRVTLRSSGLVDTDPIPAPSPALGQNNSVQTRNLTETGLAWSTRSVAQPNVTQDYDNVEPAFQDVEAPGAWNTTITLDALPDNGTANGNGTGNGNGTTVYLRAYAIEENGTITWSTEVTILVLVEDPVEIQIGGGAVDGPFAAYDPLEVTIRAGQSIVWRNADGLDMAHTATSTDGPESFDTGSIAAGATSTAITLDTPGTYTYHCSVHPNTMTEATIVVEA